MTTAVLFVLAAATGTTLRALVGARWNRLDSMPLGTLAANLAGSFLLGFVHEVGPAALTVLGVGGLGALTTFSTFARDVVALGGRRDVVRLAVYLLASCGGGVTAAAVGMALAP